ncbi:MAG: diaminopimelate decarboxylase [Deltaproteobacteria bacterium]|nr:diaminopimelate decarboxylase [Deltaproteobacteria bacterium]MBI3386674.1 diaminopimelate decarboxylase [Deltaproteobacteria bacterium]
MPESFCESVDLQAIAQRVGTPFFITSADVLRRRIADVQRLTDHPHLQARYAMKACSTRRVLEEISTQGLWIDAVSGNEVLRARAAGFRMGTQPPTVLFTADVFRDNALAVVVEHRILPNIGSPAMIDELQSAGYRGPIGVRLNPGFGHGHVSAVDTGGPSSKHGIWHDDADGVRRAAEQAGNPIVLLHAHVGSGPTIDEFTANMAKLAHFFVERVGDYPALEAVGLGGGLPHPYHPDVPPLDLNPLARGLRDAQARVSAAAGRPLRLEIEPGRYVVAPSTALVARVTDVKSTRPNDKGPGHTFAMVDAGFVDLIRPAMYGSYHHITIHGAESKAPRPPVVVAGPLCESGDVFTRGADELLQPRDLPPPKRGDLLILHDAGAYGVAMSSNYVSIGRAPQVWLEDGQPYLMSRRETVEEITRRECFERL